MPQRKTLCAFYVLFLVAGILVYSPSAYATIVVTGVGVSNPTLWNAWATSYLYKVSNVQINYIQTDSSDSALAQISDGRASFVVSDGALPAAILPDQIQAADIAQLPVVGSALVAAYNLPGLSAQLILDGTTLANIWAGNITMWDDDAIRQLNMDISAQLPHVNITLFYSEPPYDFTLTQTFQRALSTFSSQFTLALDQANGMLGGLPPAVQGRAFAAQNSSHRINSVKSTSYSLTYADWITVQTLSSKYALMLNKAGKVVSPSLASVQSAMADYQRAILSGDLDTDLFNGGGSSSWPMSFPVIATVYKSSNVTDCGTIQNLLNFFSWAQTNPQVGVQANSLGYFALSIVYVKELIEQIDTILCNGQQALSTAYLIGSGAPVPALDDWSLAYSSSTFAQQYISSNTAGGVNQVLAGTTDFGGVSSGLSSQQLAAIRDDFELVPLLCYGVVAVYNIPEIALSRETLALDLQTIADIYMNRISSWDDPKIKARNPNLADILPKQPIVIVVESIPSVINIALTTALGTIDPEVNKTVGVSLQPEWPVLQDTNRTIVYVAGATQVVVASSVNISYSFFFALSGQASAYYQLRQAALVNSANKTVLPTPEAILSTMLDLANGKNINDYLVLPPSPGSWPMVSFSSFIVKKAQNDLSKATALVNFIYWTQTDPRALQLAERNGVPVAGQSPAVLSALLSSLISITYKGKPVSPIFGCVANGQVCSSQGTCQNSKCVCNDGWEGTYCQSNATSDDSSDSTGTILGATLGTVIPVGLLLICCFIAAIILYKKNSKHRDDWEISAEELEIEQHLGTGGYGEVYKAKWRGTDVAVKMMASELVSKDMQKSFQDEVRIMTALRHPNVVLFMAACTKPPKLCIVMEYMTLGSLYELLHNELVIEIPFELKVKMSHQAARGMHFLHTSGIVHCDLKSLNLLLDSKWNIKVSDFGLTKFRKEMKDVGTKEGQGSIHWTAPEVLNESPGVDYFLADVYSFGIIIWEMLTREQPYAGMSAAAVAVAVIRDDLRPYVSDELRTNIPGEFLDLMTSCWHKDCTIRPTFLELLTRLSSLAGETSHTSSISKASTGSSGSGNTSSNHRRHSWATTSSGGSSTTNIHESGVKTVGGGRPPGGEITIVFTDITRAASLWEFNPIAMRDATLMHNETLRVLLKKYGGYEVMSLKDRNSGEGSFCMAFQKTLDALQWCMEVQSALLQLSWPEQLLEHPGSAEEWGDTDDRVIFKGLRVRIGIHVGTPRVVKDPLTRRAEYIGPAVNVAARITAMTHGGQILLSSAAYTNVKDTELAKEKNRIKSMGTFEMLDNEGSELYELKTRGLEARFFGGVSRRGTVDLTASSAEIQVSVGEGMLFKEDNYLTSANLCRWVIDFNEIQLGKQIGLGSYGLVYRGKWKGVDVAVKRFIKQNLDEKMMLEFRAEMAFLSELHHPNIVLFIGACVKRPNLCIVTEYVKQGSLKNILADNSIKLTWKQKLSLLQSAALGINYLHSLQPVIIHRDLKPSNLLVDENWNVKVADFGFTRLKEDNVTMTRCGTPCWTAPEVIKGGKHSEKSDLYSFGVIMWEVLTRKQPYAGRNFMGVSLDVLEGRRPQIPKDCPPEFRKMIKSCWHVETQKRPTMEEVLSFLDSLIGNRGGNDLEGAPGLHV